MDTEINNIYPSISQLSAGNDVHVQQLDMILHFLINRYCPDTFIALKLFRQYYNYHAVLSEGLNGQDVCVAVHSIAVKSFKIYSWASCSPAPFFGVRHENFLAYVFLEQCAENTSEFVTVLLEY